MTATPLAGGALGALLAAALVVAAVVTWPGSGGTSAVSGSGSDRRSRCARPSWLRRLTGSPDRDDDIVHLVESVGAALSAGLGPADALRLVADSRADGSATRSEVDDALPSLVLRARSGDTLSQGWHEVADQLGSTQVRLLARAWALSESSGAPLASAASTAHTCCGPSATGDVVRRPRWPGRARRSASSRFFRSVARRWPCCSASTSPVSTPSPRRCGGVWALAWRSSWSAGGGSRGWSPEPSRVRC